jgi:hypothetical protein
MTDRKPTPALTEPQEFLLGWLGEEDTSAYGECHGPDLDALVAAGLAEIGPIPPGRSDPLYRRVSLTEAGRARLGGKA